MYVHLVFLSLLLILISAHYGFPFYFFRIFNTQFSTYFNLFWEKVDHRLLTSARSVQLFRWHFISFVQLLYPMWMLAAWHGEQFFTCHHRTATVSASTCSLSLSLSTFFLCLKCVQFNAFHFFSVSRISVYFSDGRFIVLAACIYCVERNDAVAYMLYCLLSAYFL